MIPIQSHKALNITLLSANPHFGIVYAAWQSFNHDLVVHSYCESTFYHQWSISLKMVQFNYTLRENCVQWVHMAPIYWAVWYGSAFSNGWKLFMVNAQILTTRMSNFLHFLKNAFTFVYNLAIGAKFILVIKISWLNCIRSLSVTNFCRGLSRMFLYLKYN